MRARFARAMNAHMPGQLRSAYYQREMQKVLALDVADMATGVDSGDDADSGSEMSSIYTSCSSDNDSMDVEEGYDAKTFALATGDSEVG